MTTPIAPHRWVLRLPLGFAGRIRLERPHRRGYALFVRGPGIEAHQNVAGQGISPCTAHAPHPAQPSLHAAPPAALPTRHVHAYPARKRVDDARSFADG